MTAKIVRSNGSSQIAYVQCDECSFGSTMSNMDIKGSNSRLIKIRDEHNKAQHPRTWETFVDAMETSVLIDVNSLYPEEITMDSITEHSLTVKTLRIKALERDMEQVVREREHDQVKYENTIDQLREALEIAQRQLERPDCANLDGHHYTPLLSNMVYCTHCGHGITYRTEK